MTNKNLPTCFVISPFGEPFDTYFSHVIKPSVEACGLYAMRGDSLYRPTTIVDDIWREIQSAKLLIAELTGRNPNVFYELGLAHAIAKPVILIAELIDDVPFDLRAIRIILYDKSHPDWGDLLRKNLIKSIEDIIKTPNAAIPTSFKTPILDSGFEVSKTSLRIEVLENGLQRLASKIDSLKAPFQHFDEISDSPERNEFSFLIGQKVFHEKFGKGEVLQIEGLKKSERILVNFEREGAKWLATAFAKLEIINDN